MLESRTGLLREWIKTAFSINDIHGWVQEQKDLEQQKPQTKPVTVSLTVPEAKPVVRIKLGTHAMSSSGAQSSAQELHHGRGSKNLSRMNRPAETPDHKPKIPNQTPINVFWNYIESYFKPIEESDLKFLDDHRPCDRPHAVHDPVPWATLH